MRPFAADGPCRKRAWGIAVSCLSLSQFERSALARVAERPRPFGEIEPEAVDPLIDHGLVKTALGRRYDLQAQDALIARLTEGVVQARDALRVQLDLGDSNDVLV